MKILHVFDDYGTPGERALAGQGSVPTVVYYLAKHAVAKGHSVTVLERDHKVLPREEFIDGIRYVRVSADKLPAAPYRLIKSARGLVKLARDSLDVARKINKFLKKEHFDVIHVHFPFAACILVTLNRSVRKRMVYTAHTAEHRLGLSTSLRPPTIVRLFSPDIYLMKRVKKVVVLNEGLKAKLIKKGIEEEKLEAIPNGVNVKDFDVSADEVRRAKEEYGIAGKVSVLFAGNVIPLKGVHHLVKAAEIVLRYRKDVVFLIAGNLKIDEDFSSFIINYVNVRGLNSNVKVLGFVPHRQLRTLYVACDIFVLPSLEEGQSIALLEAMASKKPLIGSRVGGTPMQIKDGWNGFLVEPGNEKQLAEKILYLVENEEERKRMGNNSRKLAEDEFDWRKISEKYFKVYEEVCYR